MDKEFPHQNVTLWPVRCIIPLRLEVATKILCLTLLRKDDVFGLKIPITTTTTVWRCTGREEGGLFGDLALSIVLGAWPGSYTVGRRGVREVSKKHTCHRVRAFFHFCDRSSRTDPGRHWILLMIPLRARCRWMRPALRRIISSIITPQQWWEHLKELNFSLAVLRTR